MLLLMPAWTRWTNYLLLALLATTSGFLAFGSVSATADGLAVIRADRRIPLFATTPGTVASVLVTPGKRVEAGDPLIRLWATVEQAQLASTRRDVEAALIRTLVDQADLSAKQALATLRTQLHVLQTQLDERVVRAPESGTIGDLRVRPGQNVSPGDLLVSLTGEAGPFSVIAVFPGYRRPELRPGQALRLELDGFRYDYRHTSISRIDEEVVGPQEARRTLGREIADAIPIDGPVVVVHAMLSETTFQSDGQSYRYFDGMHATARVRLHAERLLTVLVPGTRRLTTREP